MFCYVYFERERTGGNGTAYRDTVAVTEVTGVVSFDEEEIVLETGTGKLSVEGEGLRITVLSLENGVVSAVGKINAIAYLNEATGKRSVLFGRKG